MLQLVGLELGLTFIILAGVQTGSVVYVNWLKGIMLLLVPVAWIYSARKKRLVTFLRHFGDTTANELLMQSLYGALRRFARVVVLDDSEFKPVSIPMRERITVTVMLLVICANIIGLIVVGVATNTPVERSGANFDYKLDAFVTVLQPGGSSNVSFGPGKNAQSLSFVNGFSTITSEGFIVLIGVPYEFLKEAPTHSLSASRSQSIPLWILAGVLVILAFRTSFGTWEARGVVDTVSELPAVLRGLTTLCWRIRAPRSLGVLATVIKTNDTIWQPVVKALVKKTDWIVLDCSNPSESIFWELRLVLREAPAKLIVVRNKQATTDRLAPVAEEVASLLSELPSDRLLDYDEASTKELGRSLARIVRS